MMRWGLRGANVVVTLTDGASLTGVLRRVTRKTLELDHVHADGTPVAGRVVCERVNVMCWQVVDGG